MSKRMIIIENCEDCENCVRGFLTRKHVCLEQIGKPRDCPENGTPEWCPLPEMPEKMENPFHINIYASGWNDCLDEILREDS